MKKFVGLVTLLLILVLILSCLVCTVGGVMFPPLKRELIKNEENGTAGSKAEDLGFIRQQFSGDHVGESGFVVQHPSGVVEYKVNSDHALSFLPWLILICGLLFLVLFFGLVLLLLRAIFCNPEKKKQREICFDELQQLSQGLAGLDSRLGALEEIITA